MGLVVVRSAAGRPVSSVEGAHPVAHIQRKLSHLAEAAAFQRLKARRAARSARDLAHFNSTRNTVTARPVRLSALAVL